MIKQFIFYLLFEEFTSDFKNWTPKPKFGSWLLVSLGALHFYIRSFRRVFCLPPLFFSSLCLSLRFLRYSSHTASFPFLLFVLLVYVSHLVLIEKGIQCPVSIVQTIFHLICGNHLRFLFLLLRIIFVFKSISWLLVCCRDSLFEGQS